MALGPFALADVRIRPDVAPPTDSNPEGCLPAARPTIRTGEGKRTQIDGSGRKRFIRNLFDVAANGDAATVENSGVGHPTRLSVGVSDGNNLGVCLEPSQDQKSVYQPLIEDYAAKNKRKLVLERKFDLPQYALIGPKEIKAIQERSRVADGFPFNASVIFHVSAVGFNREGTRALVYVGHNCGSLCGGGGYHFLVKRDGRWQVDQDRGLSCMWVA